VNDGVDDDLADELKDIVPPMPTSPPPTVAIPAASDTAMQLAAQFGEFLAQPAKHASARRKHWPATFDRLLTTRSQADLLALMQWVFVGDPKQFWPPKIRSCSTNPATYLAKSIDSITTAMASRSPSLRAMLRGAPLSRNRTAQTAT